MQQQPAWARKTPPARSTHGGLYRTRPFGRARDAREEDGDDASGRRFCWEISGPASCWRPRARRGAVECARSAARPGIATRDEPFAAAKGGLASANDLEELRFRENRLELGPTVCFDCQGRALRS